MHSSMCTARRKRSGTKGSPWLAWGRGEVAGKLARRKAENSSYLCVMVNLTALAPDIVAAIADETVPARRDAVRPCG